MVLVANIYLYMRPEGLFLLSFGVSVRGRFVEMLADELCNVYATVMLNMPTEEMKL